jgi:two-component system sensor histidine kinase GlrK
MIGYSVILILVIAMNVYTIVQIGQFNKVTQSISLTNNRMINNIEKLKDSILSQIRYEKKYIITHDEAFYNEFLRLKSDCYQSFVEMISIADTAQLRDFLSHAKESYQIYQLLFDEEVKVLKAGHSYPQKWYTQEKEKAASTVIEELDKSKAYTEQNTYDKIKELYDSGANVRRMAGIMTGAFLIISLSISLFINRTITKPIALMMKKTREIAKGNFKGSLNLSSPPEIGNLAEALNLMCNKLQELDKIKSDFFSSVSHELRSPLSTIHIGIELLKAGAEGTITENQKKLLTTIQKESKRVIEIVNSLLDLSKMESGMMTYTFEQKDLVPLIDMAIQEIGPLVESKKINLEVKPVKTLPMIKMDSERILQVLRNLIGNAVKFTPDKGQVKIYARSIDGGVEVSVTDTGPGIPAEDLTTIFEKFRQVSSKASQIKGTGLGLAIAKHIITEHGGKIWAKSTLGNGSTFVFVLPA